MQLRTVALLFAATVFSRLALGSIHVVKVSQEDGSLKFFPDSIDVPAGETVQFEFYPQNHSVAQSSFADPCMPIADSKSGNGTVGFWSGFMPVKSTDKFHPTFTITINDTKPIWYYCATGPHCQMGMAGVINPPKGKSGLTLAKYKEDAKKSTTTVPTQVGGGVIDTKGTPSNENNSTSTGTATGTGTTTGTGTATGTGTSQTTHAGIAGPASAPSSGSFTAIVCAVIASIFFV